jgi:hypothetical protein
MPASTPGPCRRSGGGKWDENGTIHALLEDVYPATALRRMHRANRKEDQKSLGRLLDKLKRSGR